MAALSLSPVPELEDDLAFSHFVFDAYGTLFDVHSAVAKYSAGLGPDATRLSEIWRNKQLEYSWTRSAMGKYKDFWELTQLALDFAFAAVPSANKNIRKDLLNAYMTLDCYKEVPRVLAELKKKGATTAILSNGSPQMLESAVQSAGLDKILDDVFTVHPLKLFKTAPQTYKMVTDSWQVQPSDISFQSSNRWDIAGATAFGFKCVWINRTSQPDEYSDLSPVQILSDLNGLLNIA